MSDENRRAHLRYRDPDSTIVRLLIQDREEEITLTGLIVNESYAGLACVYVGPALEVDREVIWREAREIDTPCKVLRCKKLDGNIFLLAMRIVE